MPPPRRRWRRGRGAGVGGRVRPHDHRPTHDPHQQQRRAGDQRQQRQPDAVRARDLLDQAEREREAEAAEAAGGADDAGHRADAVREAQADELEDRAVADAERAHRDDEGGGGGADRRQAGDEQQQRAGDPEHAGEDGRAAEAIAEGAAEGAQEGAERTAAGGDRRGLHLRQAVLVVEQDRQEAGEADEAAEGDRVEAGHPARVGLLQHRRHAAGRQRLGRARRLLRQHDEGGEGEDDRYQRHPEDRVPAVVLGQPRRGQRRDHGAGVAGAGDPHRKALQARRVPAAGERQRDRERGAGDAEQQADGEHLRQRAGGEPAPQQRQHDDRHRDGADLLRADAVAEQPEHEPEAGGRQQWNSDDDPLLERRQREVLGDVRAERAEQDPAHEADVEVDEGGAQRGA